jgi:hypothetical protein
MKRINLAADHRAPDSNDCACGTREGHDRHAHTVANGQSFGTTGPYEKLKGTIEFALDPADKHNTRIADLDKAPRGADGRVHFTADLYVLQPVDAARGNGALLFEIANRGRKGLLGRFNRAAGTQDPTTAERLRRWLPDA